MQRQLLGNQLVSTRCHPQVSRQHGMSSSSSAQLSRDAVVVRAASQSGEQCAEATAMPPQQLRPPQQVCELASTAPNATPTAMPLNVNPVALAAFAGAALAVYGIKRVLDTPSRTYTGNVGDEYDAWTEEGILEHYWGEHIHLGYYTDAERAKGAFKKDFIGAKYDFIDEMLKFSGAKSPKRILDVGCGFGGTSRHLAKLFPDAQVIGITLSPKQVQRGTELAAERGLTNVEFKVMDALAMQFEDGEFDLVWACESGEHMPDKQAYVDEMTRVLAPGGNLVIACWCQREETPQNPFTEGDKSRLQFLYDEWAHPYFISIEEFCRCMQRTGQLEGVRSDDWTPQTLPSWRHSVWVGVVDPWPVVRAGPRLWYKTVREIVTLERMHRAFDDGLMQYGMMAAVKTVAPIASKESQASSQKELTTSAR